MKLSICIPTYNRPNQLPNCLHSIYLAKKKTNLDFEVCVSDNGSNYDIKKIVDAYKQKLNIRLHIQEKNQGYQPNLQKAISISKGEFVWAIGDDDLLTLDSLEFVEKLLFEHNNVDFFYLNSYHLDYKYLDNFEKPFDTKNLPVDMPKLSKKKGEFRCHFWDLVDYKISFDFLLGNFLNMFRRKMWIENTKYVDKELLKDTRVWSNFHNTCGHIIIYANAFKNSNAYFTSKALTVNSYGVREWAALYPMIEIIRIPEMIDYYRSRGLSYKKYLINKNFALRNFSNYFLKILLSGKNGGLHYINFYKHFLRNLIFPNVYLSIFVFLSRKIKKLFKIEK